MNPAGLLFVAIGLVAVVAAAMDWDWFMNARKARGLAALLGRQGARAFYVLLGLALTVGGVLLTLGVIELADR